MIAAGLWLVTLLGVSAAGFCTMWEITKKYLNKIIQSTGKWLKYGLGNFLNFFSILWNDVLNHFYKVIFFDNFFRTQPTVILESNCWLKSSDLMSKIDKSNIKLLPQK